MSDNSGDINMVFRNGGQIKHKEQDYVIALRAQLAEAQREIERLKEFINKEYFNPNYNKKRTEKAEAENEILLDKLSEMIVVKATCLACSPDVKKAYENLEQANARLKERLEESWKRKGH